MSSNTVHIAVLGTGIIGKRHVAHVVSEPLTTLAAIAEPTASGPLLAQQHNVPCFSSVTELISARDSGKIVVDAAIVGTPTHTHVPLGIQLVEAGIHALVEKPISGTKDEAKKLVDAVKNANGKTQVLVGQHRRFNPYLTELKRAVDSGELGQILGIQGMWATKKGPESSYYSDWRILPSGGGTIGINLIHDVDLFRYLFGDVERVYCEEGKRTRGYPVEETGAVVLKFASGTVGTFFFSDAAASPWCFEGATGENPDLIGKYGKDVYTIFGTKGSIQLPSLQLYSFAHLDNPDQDGHWLARLSTSDEFHKLVDEPPFTLQLRHFVKVCKGEEKPSCDAEEGYKSLSTLEAIKQSMLEKKIVNL